MPPLLRVVVKLLNRGRFNNFNLIFLSTFMNISKRRMKIHYKNQLTLDVKQKLYL